MSTHPTRKELNLALRQLKKNILEKGPYKRNCGICTNVSKLLNDFGTINVSHQLHHYWKHWPECAIDRYNKKPSKGFPINSPPEYKEYDSDVYYQDLSKNKWTGEYGKSRMRLLNFLIRQTR